MKRIFALVFCFSMFASGFVLPASAQRKAIPNLAGKVLTVLGPIEPSKVGRTLMHEHIFIDFKAPPPMFPAPEDITVIQPAPADPKVKRRGLTDFDQSLAAIIDFKNIGGGTIVDVSSFGLTRDPLALKLVSRASGLNVVMGSGFYMRQMHPPDIDKLTVRQLTDIIVNDVAFGAQGTPIRSGIIGEVGVVGKPLTENELKSIRASARAARITGAPMSIHNFEPLDEMMKVLDIIESEGVDLHRVVMSHTGGRDQKTMEALFKRGVFVEWDFMGQAPLPKEADEKRVESIYAMIEAGYAKQIVLSHDVCLQMQLKENGGGGYTYIHDRILPGLRSKGVSDAVLATIMEENPRRVLTFVAPHPRVRHSKAKK
ncbi:MAG: hypothetical protein UZ17_ACD001001648 [Acidobacteria bacterium OLB17]|nr:MAG: hypothetical protein UZ17_ACD001001648 [Acidobacteria bacterium OLB17]MCZ2390757.1 aryldialkylphosphatase [Acidobacteriota bacterium]